MILPNRVDRIAQFRAWVCGNAPGGHRVEKVAVRGESFIRNLTASVGHELEAPLRHHAGI